jgi:hypothetical protein
MAAIEMTGVVVDHGPVRYRRSRPAATRYLDIEANKVASMRALSRHIAQQRASRTTR